MTDPRPSPDSPLTARTEHAGPATTDPRPSPDSPPTARTEHAGPVTLGVIWGALQSIAVEIGTTVHRTAYSEQAREGQDFSVAVFDPAGRMVA